MNMVAADGSERDFAAMVLPFLLPRVGVSEDHGPRLAGQTLSLPRLAPRLDAQASHCQEGWMVPKCSGLRHGRLAALSLETAPGEN
jgi:hypothetical protein